MARFCTNCGTPAQDNQKFCNKCGAQIGAAATPVAQPSPAGVSAPASPQAVPTTPAPAKATGAVPAPPTKQGSSAWKIIIGIVAFLALISVVAIGSCFYIGYKIKQNVKSIAERNQPPKAELSSPDLHLTEGGPGSKAATAATVDVPPYPGSTATETGGELSAGLSGGASAQEYETPDSVEKVEAFYLAKFGSKISLVKSEGNSTFSYLTSQGMTTVTITRDEEAGKTKINIMRIGK